jgi:hypothetical protein
MSEEVFYFDILPKELNYLILFNVREKDDITKLIDIPIFDDMLHESIFWEQRVKYNFPGVTWELIPDYLYKYNKRQNFTQHLNRYYRLAAAYEEVTTILDTYQQNINELLRIWVGLSPEEKKEEYGDDLTRFMEDQGFMREYKLGNINNFDVLNLYYTKKVDDELELDIEKYYELSFTYYILINVIVGFKTFVFELVNRNAIHNTTLRYNVTYQDVFNFLLHLYCNVTRYQ